MARVERFAVEAPPFAIQTATVPAAVIDLRGVGSTLREQWRWVAFPFALCVLASLVAALALPIRYEAGAKVLIDPRNLQVLQNELNPSSGNGDETELFIQSQLQVVRSTNVLTDVVDSLDLADDPDFGKPAPGLSAQLSTILFGSASKPGGEAPRAKALRALQQAVTVSRPDKTFVIEIDATTSDPAKSARIANKVAENFLKEIGRTRAQTVERAANALNARLSELGEQLRDKEEAVERYRASKGLIDANGQSVGEQQLTNLNAQLALAQAHVADQAARLEQIQKLRTDGGEPDAATDAQSTTLSALRAAYAEAKRTQAQMAMIYGPRHPANVGMAMRVQVAAQQLNAELARIARAASVEYQRARASEAELERRIASLKRDAAKADGNTVYLRELERQAASDRATYEAFLNRAKDLQERQSLDVTNARVILSATPPLNRTGLSRTVLVAAGLAFGLLAGIALALLRAQFSALPRD